MGIKRKLRIERAPIRDRYIIVILLSETVRYDRWFISFYQTNFLVVISPQIYGGFCQPYLFFYLVI